MTTELHPPLRQNLLPVVRVVLTGYYPSEREAGVLVSRSWRYHDELNGEREVEAAHVPENEYTATENADGVVLRPTKPLGLYRPALGEYQISRRAWDLAVSDGRIVVTNGGRL
jgi:hypothetical protein